jgi:hypothetical protein
MCSSRPACARRCFAYDGSGINGNSPWASEQSYHFATQFPHVQSPVSGMFLNADPQFEDPLAADFHLRAGSEMIDKVMGAVPAEDYEGRARPRGNGADVGAYERQP